MELGEGKERKKEGRREGVKEGRREGSEAGRKEKKEGESRRDIKYNFI